MRDILLIDNGSKRADATLGLRLIAHRLAERIGEPVHPVSLLHADRIPPEALNGTPAELLAPFLRRRLAAGVRDFRILPLFFGPSRALTEFVPQQIEAATSEYGVFRVGMATELCPLPQGEPALVDILLDHIHETARHLGISPSRVLLVDHGSPLPDVTAVRQWLAARLTERLGPDTRVSEAVMERREGEQYDFNGALLAERLTELAVADRQDPVVLSMLFLSPGRHAGPGGDIAEICESVAAAHPGFRVCPTPLVGHHPALPDILATRLAQIVLPPLMSAH